MRNRLLSFLKPSPGARSVTALTAYTLILAASFYVAYEIRFDFTIPPEFQRERLRLLTYVLAGKLVLLVIFRQTGSVLRYFSIPDLFRIGAAMGVASALMLASRWLNAGTYVVPRGVMLVDLILSVVSLCAFRLGLRVFQERLVLARRFPTKKHERIAVIGAGNTGASLTKDLLNMPSRGLRPVAFFDDDPRKKGTLIHGVEVVGRPEELPDSKAADVTGVVIAMPSAPQKRIREIVLFLAKGGYNVEIVPALEDLASGRAKVSRIRPIEVEDLLGRQEVELDTDSIARFVQNKVVLVTGAGGSIGSELCRQIVRHNPRRLLIMDRSEPALFIIEQELNNAGFSGTATPLVADILDIGRMHALFATYSPQVIFHAAAHKHVYLMERQPSEAIKNNSVGTRKLAEVAVAHAAEAFILISTDKAVNPTNVMGASKRLAELHLQALHAKFGQSGGHRVANREAAEETVKRVAAAELMPKVVMKEIPKRSSEATERRDGRETGSGREGSSSEWTGWAKDETKVVPPLKSPAISPVKDESSGGSQSIQPRDKNSQTKLMAVRFGNVLGSSGSVVPIFKKQIEMGGPVTVTHPDVTRYFMTIPEAVGLVLQASVLGRGGEIFALDMGQPMKIVELAKQMIELSGYKVGEDIEITFTGLKTGEKLFEELRHHTEQHLPTEHPRIMRFVNGGDAAVASCMAINELEPFVDEMPAADLKHSLKVVIPEYEPSVE
jgi:FlaA1/EpsC-like NDP-sugar epimerase